MKNYDKVINFILESGKRLATKAGKVKDIGITKENLTEEDIRIERGLKDIVKSFGSNHEVYAEEENDRFQSSENLWVIDPISATHQFIAGEPHYAVVVTHLENHIPMFAAVYDPSVDELYTAYAGQGAFLNEEHIQINNQSEKIITRFSKSYQNAKIIALVKELLKDRLTETNRNSVAVNYCAVAKGKAAGVICLSKDSFPEFAGQLIIKEAGGKFTNIEGSERIQPVDRIFIGGTLGVYDNLFGLVRKALYENCN